MRAGAMRLLIRIHRPHKKGKSYGKRVQNIRKMPESLIGRNQIGNHGFIVGRRDVRLRVVGAIFDHATDLVVPYEDDERLRPCG